MLKTISKIIIILLFTLFSECQFSFAQLIQQGEKTKEIKKKINDKINKIKGVRDMNDLVYLFRKKKEEEKGVPKLPIRSLYDLTNESTGGVQFSPFLTTPNNVKKSVFYKHKSQTYQYSENFDGLTKLRTPQILSFSDYQKTQNDEMKRRYWKEIGKQVGDVARKGKLSDYLKINNDAIEKLFGGGEISTNIRGYFQFNAGAKLNVNRSPYLTENQRTQWLPNLDHKFQITADVKIGDKLSFDLNLANKFQFDYEKLNQMKLQYKGDEDQIIQYLEYGNVGFPLKTNLIKGIQTLRGVRAVLKFGALQIQSTISQQESKVKRFTFSQGTQSKKIDVDITNYEENQHFFLAHYFREHFNEVLEKLPTLRTKVEITRVEVWVTNRNNVTEGTRDILALMDLGEYAPYGVQQITGGNSVYPAGFKGTGFSDQSNNILDVIPSSSRNSNNNSMLSFFQNSGSTDNFAKVLSARKLKNTEFSFNSKLGFISLNVSLRDDDIVAVAYRYSIDGKEYQVGEFSTDNSFDPLNPKVLYVKLLKNKIIKTNLPIWGLMMKNFYRLNAYNLDPNNFVLDVVRLDENSGAYLSYLKESTLEGKTWLELTGVDRVDTRLALQPDGQFDYFKEITLIPKKGLIMFPVLEPFGEDLKKQFSLGQDSDFVNKYVIQELYNKPKSEIQKDFPNLNRYKLRGSYSSSSGADLRLNAFNIPKGSVSVSVGSNKLVEGKDFIMDYATGSVQIVNEAYLKSGLPIIIDLESTELFGVTKKNFLGLRLDYKVNRQLKVGATILNLHERATNKKVNIGDESINNTIWGFDIQYDTESKFLTKIVNLLPYHKTKVESKFELDFEYAKFIPGHDKRHNIAGSSGTSYVDTFENSRQIHASLKSRFLWFLGGTPQRFSEYNLSNDLDYSKNRAHITWYNVDDLYNANGPNQPPGDFSIQFRSDHYQRRVRIEEISPKKDIPLNTSEFLQVLNVDYYPNLRGSYNYNFDTTDTNGNLQQPQNRWGSIMRKINGTDFEKYNVQYIEFWIMNPFLNDPTHQGGDLFLNLGSISEDVLKDGLKSVENALPTDGDNKKLDTNTNWGEVAKLAPLINAFDNNATNRAKQDVGLDGLSNLDETIKFASNLNSAQNTLNPNTYAKYSLDPSSDNFHHFLESRFSGKNAHERFLYFNNPEGNSKTAQQSRDELGIQVGSASNKPDTEDIDQDNTLSLEDEYFEYRVSIRSQDLEVGKNFIINKREIDITLADGSIGKTKWYLFRIPINSYESQVGNISDFKSIRFARMYLTNFFDKITLRFGKLDLVKGDWNLLNPNNTSNLLLLDNNADKVDPITCIATSNTTYLPDNSKLKVGVVNYEENYDKTPIPYRIPTGIEREVNQNSLYNQNTQQNEQSISVNVSNLKDGYIRAVYKNFSQNLQNYTRLKMFIHAEGEQLADNDISAIIRLGLDFTENYYEIEIPLKVTAPGSTSADAIWPSANNLNIDLPKLSDLKLERNIAGIPATQPFSKEVDHQKITVVGFPDLSKVKIILLGIKNGLRCFNLTNDDGLEKTAEVWFNEMRVEGFKEDGGWASTMKMKTKLADFGEITASGSYKTDSFGSLHQRMNELSGNLEKKIDLQTSFDMGLLFPKNFGLSIPTFFAWNYQYSLPKYSSQNPDIEWDRLKKYYNEDEINRLQSISEDISIRRSYNFTNVRKKRMKKSRVDFWDFENLSFTFAYSELDRHNYLIQAHREFKYSGNIQYNYSPKRKFITPFSKMFKGKLLTFIRDFNFNYLPTSISGKLSFARKYFENLKRNNSGVASIILRPTFKKSFTINQNYNIVWDFTKSFKVNFNATNKGIVDEPFGRIEGEKRDSLIKNVKKFGRTVQYLHSINANYKLPFSKFLGLGWLNTTANYISSFQWDTESLQTLSDPNVELGNTIQNKREIKLNNRINFDIFFNQFPAIKRWEKEKRFWRYFFKPFKAFKSFDLTYARTESTFIPGFIPKTGFFGLDSSFSAPGVGFVLGSQKDIRDKLITNDWLTKYEYQNKLYLKKLTHSFKSNVTIIPIKDLRIRLNAEVSYGEDYSSKFKYSRTSNKFENNSEKTTGNYKVSTILLGTAFGGAGASKPRYIDDFLNNRKVVSKRLGEENINSTGVLANGYADGYGPNSQDVVIPSLMAALKNRDASSITLDPFGFLPLPNWMVTFTGLKKMPILKDIFKSFDITHKYNSSYSVGNFITDNRYLEYLGYSFERNNNNDFLPRFQIDNTVSLNESFNPLIGINMRFQNDVSVNFSYNKSRKLSIGMTTGQINESKNSGIVLGVAYRATNTRLFSFLERMNLENDIQVRFDFTIKDNRTVIYRYDADDFQITAGARIYYFQPSVDFSINKAATARIYTKGTITQPYTSKSFYTAFYEFGISFRYNFTNEFSLAKIPGLDRNND